MVLVKKRQLNGLAQILVFLRVRFKHLLLPFLLGILIGRTSTIVTNSKIDLPVIEHNISIDSKSPTESQSVNKNHGVEENGWHPVYIYYGKSDAIENSPEFAPLQMKQNYIKGSQVNQDKIISFLTSTYRKMVDGKGQPYFVDLAANDATQLSNTFQLEKEGWRGLCVEPNPVYWFRLAHRKCIVAGAFVGGKTDLAEVEVTLGLKEFGGIVGEEFDNKHDEKSKSQIEKRFTTSIQSMFVQFDVPHEIDYLSLDVEGAEELVMSDFPFDSYIISFVTIERPKPGLQDLLKNNGYRFVMKLIFWGETLWVHESVLNYLSMDAITQHILSVSSLPKKRPKKGQSYFDMKTGSLTKKE
mmetsp:Transcript_8083/g.9323  ORF Transcript_8083/g.9323 Transcript_8083/m.9323 type:complete len:356 (+) Transcript_8083:22-1089(+)